MPTPLPARNILDGSAAPFTSDMKIAMGSLYDFLASLLGTTGTTADALVAIGGRTGATGSAITPSGTTAQRGTGAAGYFRFNSELAQFEGYNGTAWGTVGGGATGGAGNAAFFENDQIISQDYTLTAGKNAMSAGPITIATGKTVTVPTGATWSIV